MCGRFTLAAAPEALQAAFPQFAFPAPYAPRFNIAPGQPVLAIPNDGSNAAGFFIWGLIPPWARDPSAGARLINARAETLAEKPSFRGAFKHRRCLIPADGFYEWARAPGRKTKIPYFIHLKSRQPFAFAGLWGEWQGPDGSQIRSCTIITTQPNGMLAALHNRMPVILQPDACARWLDRAAHGRGELQSLLAPFPAAEMGAYPVSTLVDNPANDRPECAVPSE